MEFKEIKNINQMIYELDVSINRSCKVIFIATLLFCLTKNKNCQNVDKLTKLIDFTNKKIICQLILTISNK